MRLSRFWLTTQKETPADAEVISHQLMLRAGMIRQNALGVYSWLPLGLRVLRKANSGKNPGAGRTMAPNCCASLTGTSANIAWGRRMKKSSPT